MGRSDDGRVGALSSGWGDCGSKIWSSWASAESKTISGVSMMAGVNTMKTQRSILTQSFNG